MICRKSMLDRSLLFGRWKDFIEPFQLTGRKFESNFILINHDTDNAASTKQVVSYMNLSFKLSNARNIIALRPFSSRGI